MKRRHLHPNTVWLPTCTLTTIGTPSLTWLRKQNEPPCIGQASQGLEFVMSIALCLSGIDPPIKFCPPSYNSISVQFHCWMTLDMPIPRKRSCAQCRRSKTRCCLSAPRCSRCLAKKLDCDYSDALPRAANTGSTVQISWPDSQPNADATIDIGISTATREGSPGPLTRILSPDFQLDSLWETPTILEMTEGSPHTQPWFEYQNVGQFVPEDSRRPQDASPEQQSPEIYPIGPPDDNSYIEELSRSLVIPGISWCPLQTIPPMYHAILSRRQSQNFGTSLMINHLLATISTFPNMLSTQTLPPFIHRYCWSPSVDSHLPNKKHEVPEPLANCISFIPMFSSKTSASNTFVMRTLFTEVQRLHIEVSYWACSSLQRSVLDLIYRQFTFFDRPQKLGAYFPFSETSQTRMRKLSIRSGVKNES